jgi:hypothetical protein
MSVRKATESLKSSSGRRICSKHPERQATHFYAGASPNTDIFYCEKCSIMLASQGFNVVKLAPANSSRPRKQSQARADRKPQPPPISNRKH